MARFLKISLLMLFQVSSEGWSAAGKGGLRRSSLRTCRSLIRAPASAANKATAITLEKIDMVEFHFDNDERVTLSDIGGGKQAALQYAAAKARWPAGWVFGRLCQIPSFPFQLAICRDDIPRAVLVEQFPF